MFRFHLTLRTRIYLSMMAIILVSFIVTGGIALYDHYEESERYNELRLERKERAVKASMEYFLNQNGGYIKNFNKSNDLFNKYNKYNIIKGGLNSNLLVKGTQKIINNNIYNNKEVENDDYDDDYKLLINNNISNNFSNNNYYKFSINYKDNNYKYIILIENINLK